MMMTIYDIRTVMTPRVVGPKPAPRPVTPRHMSMIEDARACNRRMFPEKRPMLAKSALNKIRREAKQEPKPKRIDTVAANNARVRQQIMDNVAEPISILALAAIINLSNSATAGHLQHLKDAGMVDSTKRGMAYLWRRVRA